MVWSVAGYVRWLFCCCGVTQDKGTERGTDAARVTADVDDRTSSPN